MVAPVGQAPPDVKWAEKTKAALTMHTGIRQAKPDLLARHVCAQSRRSFLNVTLLTMVSPLLILAAVVNATETSES